MMMDRLYSTTEAGELLGGLHRNDVLHLIKLGKLRAKTQVVRGESKKPRKYVLASELERYMRELPDAVEIEPPLPKGKPRRLPTGLRAEFERVKQYV